MNADNNACYAANGTVYYDLTHVAPLFEALDGDPTRPDVARPVGDSKPVCGHGQGVRLPKPEIQASLGYFQWGFFCLDEHFSTHVDSQCHFVTTEPSLQIENPDRRYAHQFSLADLIGPIVYVDISERVRNELAKNHGKPSPDRSITDFGDDSDATVKVADLEAIEQYIVNGAYIIFNTGWECTFQGQGPKNGWYHPYNNGLNHPGVTPAVVDWLIGLEETKGIRINGLVADNIAVESGQSLLGENGDIDVDPFVIDGAYLHAVGLQRGWKLVENACNLDLLKNHAQGTGTLIVGASKINGVSGAPARLIAMYRSG